MGEIPVKVSYNNQEAELNLLVVSGNGPNLLGRDLIGKIKLDWSGIYNLQGSGNSSCQQILNKHKALFADELGTVKGTTSRFHIQADVQPKFFKARPVPYALQQKVEAELNRLEASGVIKPIQFSQWAAPIVPVVKQDGTIRVCGDYKVTVNKVAKTDTYPR